MMFLSTTVGLFVVVAACAASLVVALFAMVMAANAFDSTACGRWVIAFLAAKLCTVLTGCASVLALVLNVIRFAKHV